MKRLIDGFNAAAQDAGVDFCARSAGALGGVYMRATPPQTHAQALEQDNERFRKFYHLMLEGGIYLPPSPVEAFFLSSAHTAADIDQTVDVAARALKQLA
jgi:glutamate-1-semialdehyde 2,1-aminomutase